MRLAQDPTRPSRWEVFDEDGSRAAFGHLEIRSLPHSSGMGSVEPIVFVPDWMRADTGASTRARLA